MTLWLVRHAQPLVESGVCYGALDVPADKQATRESAEQLAAILPIARPAELSAATPITLDRPLSVRLSPLLRCKQLGHDLQGLRPDLTYEIDVRLSEMDFGQFEGQRWDSIERQHFDDWTADFWQHRFGGAESVAELMARVGAAWQEAQQSAQDQVWITHAGVIRAACLLARGVGRVDAASQWPADAPDYGQWLKIVTR